MQLRASFYATDRSERQLLAMRSEAVPKNQIRLAFHGVIVQRLATATKHHARRFVPVALVALIIPLALAQTGRIGPASASVSNTSLSTQLRGAGAPQNSYRFSTKLGMHQAVLRQAYEQGGAIALIVFDYSTGTASRVVLDAAGRKVLREQKLPGRPQSSRQEFHDAIEIVRRDPRLGHFLTNAAVPEGGFIVDGPPDHPSQDRYIQVRLLSPDRRSLLRLVLVDLTLGVAASDRAWYE